MEFREKLESFELGSGVPISQISIDLGLPEDNVISQIRELLEFDQSIGYLNEHIGVFFRPEKNKETEVFISSPLDRFNKNLYDHQHLLEKEEAYKLLTEQNPQDYDAWYELGIIYSNHNNELDAMMAFHTVIENKPNHSLAYANLGRIYYKLRKYTKAIEAWDNATKLSSDKKRKQKYQHWIEYVRKNMKSEKEI